MIISEAKIWETFELARLVNSAYRGDTSRKGWTTEADLLDGQRIDAQSLENFIEKRNQTVLTFREREGAPLLGCVCLQRLETEWGVACHLGMLTIDPMFQAKGFGRKLIEGAEQFARAWNATRMVLDVIPVRLELTAWYERRGYRPTGKSKPFPFEDKNVGNALRPDLTLVEFEKVL